MRQTRRDLGAVLGAILAAAILGSGGAVAQGVAENTLPPTLDEPGQIMLTVFLRHDETKTVDQINEHLRQTGWYDKFPPPGVDVVAWFMMMGIGQVVIVRLPPPIDCATPIA